MNAILDTISDAGYLLDTPGALLRGLLAGKPGERASGTDLLDAYGLPGGPLGGMAAEVALDPLALGGLAAGAYGGYKGIRGLTAGGLALEHADDANPLLRGIGHLIGREEGAMGPDAIRLAEEVAGQPWHYRSYDPTFHPDQVDPLAFPWPGPKGGEMGSVRGVVGLTAADAAPRPRGLATDAEMARDLAFAEDPITGRNFPPNSFKSSPLFGRQRWKAAFPDAGLDPASFEATVAPRGVLDVRDAAPRGGLRPLLGGFADRAWEARQRLVRGLGFDWPEIHPGRVPLDVAERMADMTGRGGSKGRMLGDLLDPMRYFEVSAALPEKPHYFSPLHQTLASGRGLSPEGQMELLGDVNHDLMKQFGRSRLSHGDFWSSAGDPDLEVLKAMGFDRDPLRQFLADQGYDAILGQHHFPASSSGPEVIETMLNILDPKAIRTWESRLRPNDLDWRPTEFIPEDYY